LDFNHLTNKELGRALLNVYQYRRTRADRGDPSLIDLVVDIDLAIKSANLTELEKKIIRTHYDIMGGDAIKDDYENKQQQTANYLGIHRNTVGNNLNNAWERIGRGYRGDTT